MLERLRPFASSLSRRLGRGQELEEASVEAVVLQPEEVERRDPPLALPGQLAKARGVDSRYTTLDQEVALATATEVVHAPVVRYTLPDCVVHPAGVDFPGGSLRIRGLRPRGLLSATARRIPRATYCMTTVIHDYFGHWLQDACATALLRRDDEALLLDVRPDWPHTAPYADAFGFDPLRPDLQIVERLAVFEDYGQGSSKRARYAELRHRLARAFPAPGQGSPRVYFRRGATGVARHVADEEAVIAALATRGFEVFDLAGASAGDIASRFRHAEFVVSIDGSHLSHLYFTMPPDSGLMTFIEADRFIMTQVGYAAATGLRLGYMIVDPTPGGYDVSLPDLHATLDLMGL